MPAGRSLPDNPLEFIKQCVHAHRVQWTYHVNMRLAGRHISRNEILDAVDTYTIIESYLDDKYLPSYLVLALRTGDAFHVLFALDVDGDNVRVVTAYHPSPEEWEPDLRSRRDNS